MKILLAEDEKDMSAALVAILTHSGYEVDPVYDGEAAVQMAQRHSYDCMVFDIMMPKLDGVQALQQIRDAGHHADGQIGSSRPHQRARCRGG